MLKLSRLIVVSMVLLSLVGCGATTTTKRELIAENKVQIVNLDCELQKAYRIVLDDCTEIYGKHAGSMFTISGRYYQDINTCEVSAVFTNNGNAANWGLYQLEPINENQTKLTIYSHFNRDKFKVAILEQVCSEIKCSE